MLGAAELLFISTVIQIALALPMAWYFHRATTMALPANALVIPIAEVLLPAAVVAVALSYVSAWLAYVPAVISATCARRADRHDSPHRAHAHLGRARADADAGSSAARPQPLSASLCCWRDGECCWPRSALLRLLAAAAWIVLFPPKPQWHPGVFEVTAIDVGQGDSLLLITPEGKTLLLDAGGVTGNSQSEFDVGEEVVSPYLWSRGIRRLDAVAVLACAHRPPRRNAQRHRQLSAARVVVWS